MRLAGRARSVSRIHDVSRSICALGRTIGLMKPRAVRCEECRRMFRRRRKVRISAHHYDYARPFDVAWLCSFCHTHADFVTARVIGEVSAADYCQRVADGLRAALVVYRKAVAVRLSGIVLVRGVPATAGYIQGRAMVADRSIRLAEADIASVLATGRRVDRWALRRKYRAELQEQRRAA